MSKFRVGDDVVCIDNEDSDLDLYRHYKIKSVPFDDGYHIPEYYLEGEDFTWMESRFELLSVWEKHQVPSLMHVPDYQDIHQQLAEAKRLLNKAAEHLEDCHSYTLAEEINEFLGEN